MEKEITTTGSKKVATIQEAKKLVAKGETILGVDTTKTLSEAITKMGTGQISLTGSKSSNVLSVILIKFLLWMFRFVTRIKL